MLDIIAHNIRSAENVGSLIRTMDGLGAHKIWLTGYTPNITHSKVQKTALGADKNIFLEKVLDVDEVFVRLREMGFEIIGLELDKVSKKLSKVNFNNRNIALLLGNEVEGIPNYLRSRCDELVYIPQKGIKESLNVAIATAIAMWEILKNN